MTDFTRIKLRISDASLWTSANPTLLLGEVGIEGDTKYYKVGDGSTAWTSLSYANGIVQTKTAAAWTSADTVLLAGQLGLESDTLRLKGGDGATAWTSLSYITPLPQAEVNTDSKNLILTLTDTDTVGITADKLMTLTSAGLPTIESTISDAWVITTDTVGEITPKASHWYELWRDSAGVMIMAPLLTGSADSDVLNTLSDSTQVFETEFDGESEGIIRNTTAGTKANIVSLTSQTDILMDADIFPAGTGDYEIQMTSPSGLGASKAVIGKAWNDGSNDLTAVISYADPTWNSVQVAKAWVNFDGTGTVTIKDSYNVSSITDNGVGDYTVNFLNAFANDDYSVFGIAGRLSNQLSSVQRPEASYAQTALACRILTMNAANTKVDSDQVNLLFFGDLE